MSKLQMRFMYLTIKLLLMILQKHTPLCGQPTADKAFEFMEELEKEMGGNIYG